MYASVYDLACSSSGDEPKRLGNLDQHGVDFLDAALIFDGTFIESENDRNDYGERRSRALGRVDDDYFMVAFTWRGDVRRIISA